MFVLVLIAILQLLVLAGCAVGCVAAYRRIRNRSRVIAGIFVAGFLLRAALGLTLFAISYFDLPIAETRHEGGFWDLAPDARNYYNAAAEGLWDLGFHVPSPAYVGALGVFMRLVGISPATPLMFNLLCYTLTVVLILWSFGDVSDRVRARAAALAAAAFSLSPLLILVATQALKDSLVALLIVSAVATGCATIQGLQRWPPRVTWVFWVTALGISVLIVAGVRAYYAVFISLSAGGVCLAIATVKAIHRDWRVPTATLGVCAILWVFLALGSGPYYRQFGTLFTRVTGLYVPLISTGLTVENSRGVSRSTASWDELSSTLAVIRHGYLTAAGRTNLAGLFGQERPDLVTLRQMAGETVVGVAAMVVPISALELAGVVAIESGPALQAVTDVDTVFIDLMLIAAALLIVRERMYRRAPLAQFCFVAIIGIVSGLLIGYVVINYGTLFRLRLLAVAPVWLLPLVMSRRSDRLPVVTKV